MPHLLHFIPALILFTLATFPARYSQRARLHSLISYSRSQYPSTHICKRLSATLKVHSLAPLLEHTRAKRLPPIFLDSDVVYRVGPPSSNAIATSLKPRGAWTLGAKPARNRRIRTAPSPGPGPRFCLF
ncbi:hypothetical protein C8J57DRAFT_120057 [Mycena rebaudengoi]|nr:hypothetical protein C8J57DRAFT_120057 [Mycena rebaudengoi]